MGASNLREPTPGKNGLDGRAAYRDDRAYTSPEMRPGHGENVSLRPHQTGGMAALLGGPAAGAALAMEAFTQSMDLGEYDREAKPLAAVVRRVVARIARRPSRSPADLPSELLRRAQSRS